MLAIHGIWAHGVLSLWAEDSEQLAAARLRRDPASSRRPARPATAPVARLARDCSPT